MKSDIEIARSIELKKIKQVAESVGIPREEVENYGRYIAKIPEQSDSGDRHYGNQGGYWQNNRFYRSGIRT